MSKFFISFCKTNCLTLNRSLTVSYLRYICNFFKFFITTKKCTIISYKSIYHNSLYV